MPFSRTSYTGNGSTHGPYTAPSYLEKAHVTATVDGVAATFAWTNDTQITFTSSAPGNSTAIVIQRTTPDGTTSFANGAALNQDALNTMRVAAQYQAEEVEDQATDLQTDVTAVQATTGHATSGNTALNTRLLTAEGHITDLLAINADRFAVRGTGVSQTYTHGNPQADFVFASAAHLDPDSGWDGTSEFTVPSTGLWHFTANFAHDAGVTVGEAFRIDLNFSDGQVVRMIYTVPLAGSNSCSVSGTVYLSASVRARVRIISSGSGSGIFRTSTAANDMTFNGFKVGS